MMEDIEDGSSYFLEVFDQIQSVSLVLRGTDYPKQLELQPRKIIVKKFDETTNEYPLVVTVDPDSYTAIQQHTNEGVGIRLQLREDNPIPPSSLLSTAVKRVGGELSRLECGSCQCGCKTCGLALFVGNVKFNRVLPLPSQTWRDLFNNWSCCSSSCSQGKTTTPAYVTKSAFKPREGDCLLDEFNIYVHSKVVEKRNVLLGKLPSGASEAKQVNSVPHCVKCARCRAVLGEAQSVDKCIESWKLDKNSIEVLAVKPHLSEPVVKPIFFSEFFLERLLGQQLTNAVTSHSTHMFVLRDSEGKNFLLVRVVSTTTRLFVNNGNSTGEMINATAEMFLNSKKDERESCKEKKSHNNLIHHSGDGDNLSGKSPADGGKKGRDPGSRSCDIADVEDIRQDDPPRMLGSKVAEVIERLLSFSTHLISIGRSCGFFQGSDPSGCERIVKVMYSGTFHTKHKSMEENWLKDDRTLTLTYPNHVWVQILLILLSSTLTMPVANRLLGDFLVGFLRLD